MDEDIRKWLISIINEGNESPYRDEFASLTAKYAKYYLLDEKEVSIETRKRLYQDNSIYDDTEEKRLTNLALLCIAELFYLDKENKCYQIIDFFDYEEFDVKTAPVEEIISKLITLVYYTSHDFIYDSGDINYKRLRNALNNCLRRNKIYKKKFINRKKYIHTSLLEPIDYSKPQIESEKLTQLLFGVRLKNPSNCKLLYSVFEIINNQDEFNRVVYYNTLVQSILEYNKKISISNFEETADLYEDNEGESKHLKEGIESFTDPFKFEEEFKSNLFYVIKKNSFFKKIILNNILYVYTCRKKDINSNLEQYPVYRIIKDLRHENAESIEILVILKLIYIFINKQNLYNKAVLYSNLEISLLNYYMKIVGV